MKKTLKIDAELLAAARASCHARTDTEVRAAATKRLIAYSEPGARDVPRRREPRRPTNAARRGGQPSGGPRQRTGPC